MSRSIGSAVVNSDAFSVWLARTNDLINSISTEIVTANSSSDGANTTGNGFVIGVFGSTTLVANTLRGGSIATAAELTISSNIAISGTKQYIGNSTVNVFSNSTLFQVANSTLSINVMAGQIETGLLLANGSHIRFGNSTVNTTINTTAFAINGANVATVSNRASVALANTLVGSRGRTNFIAGNNISFDVTDDSSGGQVNVSISYNENTSATFTTYTNSNTDQQNLDSFVFANYRGATYELVGKDNNNNNYIISKISMLYDGSTTQLIEYGTIESNTAIWTFDATSNSTQAILQVTPSSANTTIKYKRQLLPA